MNTIIVVDDHPIVLEGLHNVLAKLGYNVLKASSASQTMTLAKHLPQIDLFIIDLSLKEGTDGLDLISELRSEGLTQPIIIYTMHEELWNISQLMHAQVEGIVLKGDDINELCRAIERVAAGGIYRSDSIARRYEEVTHTKGILSGRDIEVLRRLSKGETTHEIADNLNIGNKAVEYHRSNILKKLGARNMTEATRRGVRLGIICSTAIFLSSLGCMADNSRPIPVDLGLSVKWADRNLDAESPLSPGGYYAFGETEVKDYYDWSTCLLCIDGDWANQRYIGEETIAGTGLDAAYVSLGEGWRIPRYDEMSELLEKCTFEFVEEEQDKYMRFTSASGEACIEIPIVGYMSLDRVVRMGIHGCIWCGDFDVEEGVEDGVSYRLHSPFYIGISIDGKTPAMLEGSPQLGLQIRPVFAEGTGVSSPEGTTAAITSICTIDGRTVNADTEILSPGLYIVTRSDGSSFKHLIRPGDHIH